MLFCHVFHYVECSINTRYIWGKKWQNTPQQWLRHQIYLSIWGQIAGRVTRCESLPGFSSGSLYLSWCLINTSTSVSYHPGTPCQKQSFVRYAHTLSLLVFLTFPSGCTKCVDFLKVRLNQLFIVQSRNLNFAIDLLPELVSWRLVGGLPQ